ncbi:BMP family lipoprotein [Granulicoccus sp. GXG6511]|uniref:BMP family lipoprotein n=1 Tax=Granulicoccus sp. GXG6511 TaxID=3381351 RepID=UPI003D7CF84B
MRKTLLVVPAMVGAAALTLSSCAAPPEQNTTPAPGNTAGATGGGAGDGDYKACMVSDAGGFDDKSFNQTSYKGLTDAKDELGIEIGQVESSSTADFAKNIQAMVDANCDTIVTVGFLLSDATMEAAKANPNIHFAIVDDNPEGAADVQNLKPLVFNTAESSFLAGYLAAAQSKTGKVGTFGGMQIPTVTIFMDGFAQGVSYHNEQKSTDVQVIGWDSERQDGQFVPQPNPFENVQGGRQTAQNLISQGADIIFPVAGPAGLGGLEAAKASNGNVSAIWVDTDGCESTDYCAQLISSVYKGMDVAVFDAIKAAKDGEFSNEPYIGTLANDGTGLSPFHDFDDQVSAETKSELEKIRGDIESGTITIESQSQPKQ